MRMKVSPLIPTRKPRVDFDWRTISKPQNHREFEDLALDLLAETCNEDLLTKNALRSGRDGGADGVYTGRMAGSNGPWKIACAVRQNLSAAKAKLIEEIGKAKKGGFRGLLFATSYDASPAEVRTLQNLARSKRLKVVVWARRKLDDLLRKNPWVAATYMGQPLIPGFVPANAQSELDVGSQRDMKIVGREDDTRRILDFLDGSQRVLLLLAAGGSGKSRLLRELPAFLRDRKPRRSAWLRRIGQTTVTDALASGLPTKRPLVLCLDDAGRAEKEARDLARVAMEIRAVDAKVILAARDADREVLERALREEHATISILQLGEVGSEAATKIAKTECPSLSIEDATRLGKMFGKNLFLLRAAAQLVRAGRSPRTLVDEADVADSVADRFIEEATKHLFGVTADKDVRRLLFDMALNVPLPGRGTDWVEGQTLLEAGLLRKVGSTVRFRSDVEGDLVLRFILRTPAGKALVNRELTNNPDKLFPRIRNLAAAGNGTAAEMIKTICARWLANIGNLSDRQCGQMAEALPYCVYAAPGEVAAIGAALATNARLSTDAFGPIVQALGRNKSSGVTAVRLVRDLATAGIKEGTYDNYKLRSLGADIVNPAFHDFDRIREISEEMERWLTESAIGTVSPVVEAVVDSFLRTTVHWDVSDGIRFTWNERPLPPTAEVLKMRALGVRLLRQMLGHHDRSIRASAANALLEHARGNVGMTSGAALDKMVAEEFALLAPDIERRLGLEADLDILTTLEEGLIHRWGAQRPGEDLARQLLLKIPRSARFKAFQLCRKNYEWNYDMPALIAAAPAEERWHWWVDRRHRIGPDQAEIEQLACDLSNECATPEAVADLVKLIVQTAAPFLILDALCAIDRALFEKAVGTKIDGSIDLVLKRVLRRNDFRLRPEAVVEAVEAKLSSGVTTAEVRETLSDAGRIPPPQLKLLAERLVGEERVDLRIIGLDLIRLRGLSPKGAAAIFATALRDGDWSGGLHIIWSLAHPKEMRPHIALGSKLARFLEQRLAEAIQGTARRHSDLDEWDMRELAEVLFTNDDIRRLDLVGLVLGPDYWLITAAGSLCKPMVQSVARFVVLTEHIVRWVSANKLTSVAEVDHLLQSAIDRGSLPGGAFPIAMKLVGDVRKEAQMVGLAILSEERNNPEACAVMADLAVGTGPWQKEAHSAMSHFSHPLGTYSRAIGKPAPAIVAASDTLEKAAALTKIPEARQMLAARQAAVIEDIEADLREDEELADPR
jgi:hypothetical protein